MASYNYEIDPAEVEEYLADVESVYITDHLDHNDFTTLVDELAEKKSHTSKTTTSNSTHKTSSQQ